MEEKIKDEAIFYIRAMLNTTSPMATYAWCCKLDAIPFIGTIRYIINLLVIKKAQEQK